MAMKKKNLPELVPYIFEHEKFGKVRAINLNGEPLLVGRDIATALGYSNTRKALIDHVPDKFKRIINAKSFQQMASQSKGHEMGTFEIAKTLQQMASQSKTGEMTTFEIAEWEFDSPRGLTFINEQGMYRLILRSNLPAAEQFTDWACEVLVSIRKTGFYGVQKVPSEMETLEKIFGRETSNFLKARELKEMAAVTKNQLLREGLIRIAASMITDENFIICWRDDL